MASIDQQGLEEIQKIENALRHAYDKLEKDGKGDLVLEEYGFIFKIITDINDNWEKIGVENVTN
tara:strand:+ start:350 stop:541 length:192 start_codon:yes stop_codon:yes gene_type:complete